MDSPSPLNLDSYPSLMTVEEVATVMRVGSWSIYQMIRQGRLPGQKYGRHLRVSREQLRAVLEGRA